MLARNDIKMKKLKKKKGEKDTQMENIIERILVCSWINVNLKIMLLWNKN